MLRIQPFEELTAAQVGNCAGAVVSTVAAWWGLLGETALQLMGVPLPVVMAAAAGAFIARTHQPSNVAFWRAFLGSSFWVVGACALTPFAAPVAKKYLEMDLPAGASAGAAFLVALVGPFLFQLALGWARSKYGQKEAS